METIQIDKKKLETMEKLKKYLGWSKKNVTDEDLRKARKQVEKEYLREHPITITPEDEKRILKKYEKILKKN